MNTKRPDYKSKYSIKENEVCPDCGSKIDPVTKKCKDCAEKGTMTEDVGHGQDLQDCVNGLQSIMDGIVNVRRQLEKQPVPWSAMSDKDSTRLHKGVLAIIHDLGGAVSAIETIKILVRKALDNSDDKPVGEEEPIDLENEDGESNLGMMDETSESEEPAPIEEQRRHKIIVT